MASAAIVSSVVAPYSHDHFQSLPMIKDARNRFLEVNGDAIVADNIKSLFVAEGMDRTFGLAMIHRHFDLQPNQKLVEYNGTSTPWDCSQTTVGMRTPQPHMWAFDKDGLLKPTEFRYAEKQDEPWTEKELAFAAKFKATLDTLNLSHLFGLARYPGDDFAGSCEFTEGTANINLKPEDYPPDLKHIPTIWWFSAPLWQRGCRCTCNSYATGHPHGAHVYTTSV